MKSVYASLIVLFVVLMSFGGCALDEEIDIPGGSSDAILKYLGTWSVTDNAAKLNYEVTIDRSELNSSMVIIRNFAGSGARADGLVVSNSLIVEDQEIGSGWYVSGSGRYVNENLINFNYTLEIGGEIESRVATFRR